MSKLWLDEEELSKWFYYYCFFGKYLHKVYNLKMKFYIKNQYYCYLYCRDIKDDPEVRKNITESGVSWLYCRDVEDRQEIRENITESVDAFFYCRSVSDRQEIKENITEPRYIYLYCKNIKYDEEFAKIARKNGYNI